MLLGICVGTWSMGVWFGAGLLTADDGARAALASEASGQRGNSMVRAPDTRPEPGSSARASVGLGAVLALYGLLGLGAVEFYVPARLEPWLSPLIGAITGVVTAATGVYMIPSAPYLQALGLEKDDLVQALGLSFTVSTLALAGILVHAGSLGMSVAGVSLLALVPALAGMMLGQWVRTRVRSRAFRILLLSRLARAGCAPGVARARVICVHVSGATTER